MTAPLTLTQRATIALTALQVISMGKPNIAQGLDLIEQERNQLLAVAAAVRIAQNAGWPLPQNVWGALNQLDKEQQL